MGSSHPQHLMKLSPPFHPLKTEAAFFHDMMHHQEKTSEFRVKRSCKTRIVLSFFIQFTTYKTTAFVYDELFPLYPNFKRCSLQPSNSLKTDTLLAFAPLFL